MKYLIRLKGLLVIIVLLAFSLSTLQCGEGERSETAKDGGVARIALHNARGDLFPYSISESGMRQLSENLFSPALISYDESGQETGVLAESWEIAEDRMSVTFRIKSGIKWSNGDSLTAADVQFSYNLAINPVSKYRLRSQLSPVRDVVILDNLTCRFEFNRPVADPLYHSKIPVLPVGWSKYISDPAEIEKRYLTAFVGCGPFLLTSVSDDSLVAVRNTSNPQFTPHLDKVVIYFSRIVNNGSGKLPIDIEVNLPIEKVSQYQSDSSYQIMTYPERGYTFLAWNLKGKLTEQYDLRRAFSLGIDRETIVDGVLAGFGSVIDIPAYQNYAGLSGHVFHYQYDPVMAQKILDSLGWRENETGMRVRSGRPLRFTLKTNYENQTRTKVALNIVRNLAAIGINVELVEVSWDEIIKSVSAKDFEAMLITWIDADRYNPSDLFHSAGIKNGLNLTSYASPLADSLIERGLNEMDPAQRSKAWQGFHETVARDLPCTFLYNQQIITSVHVRLQGVRMDHRGYLVSIKDWWISGQ